MDGYDVFANTIEWEYINDYNRYGMTGFEKFDSSDF